MSETKRTNRFPAAIYLAAAAILASGTLAAQEKDYIEVETTVHKEVTVETDDGKRETTLVPAEKVVPGERVVYTIKFRNVGDEPADNVVITNPISDSLVFVAGSATNPGARVEFSIDGGQSFAVANELRISVNGVERPASARDYTHVRWVMQTALAVGAEGSTSFAADLE
ncbi:MAG: hypothetical protein ACE5F8_03265 [Woeseiaceae bacterium]